MRAIRLTASKEVWKSLIAVMCVATSGAMLASTEANSGDRVQIAVEGRITPKCDIDERGLSSSRHINLGEANKAGKHQFDFGINCNAPFKYTIESTYGAMVSQTQLASLTPQFAREVPYTVSVHIPTDDVDINDRCPSKTIKAGHVTCPLHDSRNGIAIDQQGTVTVEWAASPKPLLAGAFSDQLTIKVGVRQ